jgi:hypothetical protein
MMYFLILRRIGLSGNSRIFPNIATHSQERKFGKSRNYEGSVKEQAFYLLMFTFICNNLFFLVADDLKIRNLEFLFAIAVIFQWNERRGNSRLRSTAIAALPLQDLSVLT